MAILGPSQDLTLTLPGRLAIRVWTLLPGFMLASGVASAAWLLSLGEARLVDQAAVGSLVIALLLGMVIRLLWVPPDSMRVGIAFASKQVLEFAIVLLGASLNLAAIASAGPVLASAVVLSVSLGVMFGIVLGRRAGLAPKLAVLVAVGNAICGNSAIVAVAPSIRAKKEEIASAIATTAVLGVGLVLLLPLLATLIGLSDYQFGVLAGLTIYAVPQVLAATYPVSVEAGQIGTLVKLTRVLLLAPVVAIFAYLYRQEETVRESFSLTRFLPWFVIGFILVALARTIGAIPAGLGLFAQDTSKLLTLFAMAALGLSVDIRAVGKGGTRVTLVVAGLMTMLILLGLSLIALFGMNA